MLVLYGSMVVLCGIMLYGIWYYASAIYCIMLVLCGSMLVLYGIMLVLYSVVC